MPISFVAFSGLTLQQLNSNDQDFRVALAKSLNVTPEQIIIVAINNSNRRRLNTVESSIEIIINTDTQNEANLVKKASSSSTFNQDLMTNLQTQPEFQNVTVSSVVSQLSGNSRPC